MPVAVLDTETTGRLGDARVSVIEVGICIVDEYSGDILGQYDSLVRPRYSAGPWCREALEVTGISAAEANTAPLPSTVWEEMLRFCSDFQPVREFVSWNSIFDRKMMTESFQGAEHLPWGPCLMRVTSHAHRGNRKGYSLTDAAAHAGIEVEGRHRALADARTAALIFRALIRAGEYEPSAAVQRKAEAKKQRERDRKLGRV